MFMSNRPELKKVVRVAVTNNFNCTPAEFRQLKQMELANPDSFFFVNCNINTPDLNRINDNTYKVVLTINPTFTITSESIARLHEIDKDKIAFVRVKYIPARPDHVKLIKDLAKDNYAVVVTTQRWNGLKSLSIYTDKKYYTWEHNRFRLSGEALKEVTKLVDSFKNEKVFLCDRIGGGCGTCKLCVMLTAGQNLKLASVNLSSSGICKFNCPDCYAKRMQELSFMWGNYPIQFDKIKANAKQSGSLQHNKDALKNLQEV